MDVALEALRLVPTEELVSHRFPVEEAASAYALVANDDTDCLQVLLTYT